AELAHVNRVTAMGQLAASISHEVMQPITAGVNNAGGGLDLLGAQPPRLGGGRAAPGEGGEEGKRAPRVIRRHPRPAPQRAPPRKDTCDINEAIRDVVGLTHGEMVKNDISAQTQLAEDLPRVQGDKVQLQQVILNVIINAVDAMSSVSTGPRELLISTAKDV